MPLESLDCNYNEWPHFGCNHVNGRWIDWNFMHLAWKCPFHLFSFSSSILIYCIVFPNLFWVFCQIELKSYFCKLNLSSSYFAITLYQFLKVFSAEVLSGLLIFWWLKPLIKFFLRRSRASSIKNSSHSECLH